MPHQQRGRGASRPNTRAKGRAKKAPAGRSARVADRKAAAKSAKKIQERAQKPLPKASEVRRPVEPDIETDGFRSGYVALVGRPNVGKSTLLNALLGQKIAATTHKPQTTRKNLLGVLHPKGAQVLLLDTPGYHQAKGPLNRYMVAQAEQGIADADVVGYVVEARADAQITPGNERLVAALQKSKKTVVLLLNKVDRVSQKEGMLLQIEAYKAALGDQMVAVVPISAVKKRGLERVVKELGAALPLGPEYFDEGTMTDQSERSIVAEMIREKVMLATSDELPYSAAVTLDLFEDARPRLVRIMATVHVERDSQKPIVIGKRGERVKTIGTSARRDIEFFLESKVYLELHVRVTGDWSNDRRRLIELGYHRDADSADEAAAPVGDDLQAEIQAALSADEET